jgi:hypothetical protein
LPKIQNVSLSRRIYISYPNSRCHADSSRLGRCEFEVRALSDHLQLYLTGHLPQSGNESYGLDFTAYCASEAPQEYSQVLNSKILYSNIYIDSQVFGLV